MSVPQMIGSGLYNAVSGIFYRAEGVPYMQHIFSSVFRVKYGATDYSQPTNTPTAPELYRAFAKKKGFEPKVVELESGGNGVWFGSPTAKHVFFYLPGGGYVWSLVDGHIAFLHNLQQAIDGSGKEFAIFCFSYDLAPQATHPTQLKQAVTAFNYLLKTTGLQPQDIILGGDSAGANLSLMLLSHAVHSHVGVEALDLNGRSLRAAVLLCPWVTMEKTEGPNLERNKDIDYISESFLGGAVRVWLSKSEDSGFTSPLKNDPSWWKDVPCDNILVTGGEYEYFVDDIDAIVEKLKVHKKVEYLRGRYEIHDHFVVAASTGLPPCETDRGLRTFIKSKL